MNRYEKYKDSGVEWLGEIPEHWGLAPIKHLFEFTTGFTPPTNREDYYSGDLDWVTISDMNEKYISSSKNKITEKAVFELSKNPIPIGSLMYSFKLSVGKVAFASKELYTNEAIFSIFPKDGLKLEYYYYALQDILINNANENIYGAKLLNQELILNSILPKITLTEQQKIAEYLDYTVGRVDALVSEKEGLINKLQEKRKSLINEVVTKGLNPDAPMRDSGIEWLGKIPQHWQVIPFKYSVNINNGRDYKHIVADAGYPVIGSGGQFAYATEYMYDGEVVFLGRKGTIDKPQYFNGRFWAVDTMFYVIANKETDCKYLFYQSLGIPFDLYSTVTALPSMTQSDLNGHPICVPPYNEQQKIAEYLDYTVGRVDELVKELKVQITKFKEYKTSIISEAVTGKIDLREWMNTIN